MLEDIAVLTGATVITEDLGLELKDATMAALGQASKVTVDKDSTVIVEGAGSTEAIANRVKGIFDTKFHFFKGCFSGRTNLNNCNPT